MSNHIGVVQKISHHLLKNNRHECQSKVTVVCFGNNVEPLLLNLMTVRLLWRNRILPDQKVCLINPLLLNPGNRAVMKSQGAGISPGNDEPGSWLLS